MIAEINVYEADSFYHLTTLCFLVRATLNPSGPLLPYTNKTNILFTPWGTAAIIFTYTSLLSLVLEPISMHSNHTRCQIFNSMHFENLQDRILLYKKLATSKKFHRSRQMLDIIFHIKHPIDDRRSW